MKCLPKATAGIKACTVLFPCIVVLQGIAMGTDFWEATAQTNNETEWEGHRGLFKDCRRSGNSAYLCESIEHPPSWLASVRAMESVGICGIGFLSILTLIFSVRNFIALLFRVLSILISMCTGMVTFAGMFTYAHNKSIKYWFHISFYLCVASVIGIVVCTFLLIRDLNYHQQRKTERNYRNYLMTYGGHDSGPVSNTTAGSTNSEREIPDQQLAETEVIELPEVYPDVPPPAYSSFPPPNYILPPPSYDMLESEGLI